MMKRFVFISLLILALAILCSCSLLPCKHTEVVDAAVAPTCTEMGLTEGKHCSKCGEVTQPQQSVLATGHTQVVDEAVSATCTEDGLTSGLHCSVCNQVIIERQVVPAAHTYGEWEKVSDPDCFIVGEENRLCSVCDYVDSKEIPTVEHEFSINEENGLSTCSLCDAVIFKGHLYAVIDRQMTWYDAYAECEKLGGHLATVTSADEQEIITALMNSFNGQIYWIGGFRNNSGWEWVTEEKFGDFLNWRPNQPDNHGNKEYFLMVYGHNSIADAGLWNDLNANMTNYTNLESAGYICEWDLDITEDTHTFCDWKTVSSSTCFIEGEEMRYCTYCGVEEFRAIPKVEHNFLLDEASGTSYCQQCSVASYNGHTYLIVTTSMIWFDAYTYCKELGGDLVSITSAEEQAFIDSYMTAKSHKAQTWIGLYSGDGSNWYWTSGEEFVYSNWHSSQPDTASEYQYFGAMNWRDLGQWDDYGLTSKLPFICEWD